MKIKKVLTIILLASSCAAFAQSFTVNSPNKKISLSLHLNAAGALVYHVNYKNKPIIEPSNLGFKINDQADLLNNFSILQVDSSTFNETWTPVWGETKTIVNNYKEIAITLKEKGDKPRILQVVFKVFNDGVGFRYHFPEQPNLFHFVVADELSTFNLTGDHKIWWMPGDFDTNEYTYNTSQISEIEKLAKKRDGAIFTATPIKGAFVQTPLMIKTKDNVYVNIHEAALINYPAMDLKFNLSTFEATSTLANDAVGNKAYMRAPCSTPWRTIIVSDDARDIIASKTILNLNEPCKLTNTNYIKPMKYCGIWLEMHLGLSTWDFAGGQSASDAGSDGKQKTKTKHGATTENTKKYIDFAAKNGFGGVLVEGWNEGWEDWFGKWKEDVFDFVTPYPDYDFKGLNAYAQSKGVGMITHHETSGSVTNYERWIDSAYRLMASVGSHALKSGYVGKIIPRGEFHDGQWMVNHYLRAIKKAAQYDIMVVAHEPVRPTGLHRTYPNFMAAEAARGQEFNFWSEGNPPEHETILPFTRLMGGPMDYTPGIFEIKMSAYDITKKEQVHSTLAKQLALYVTMYSPLQMAADLPENYEKHLDAFQFIKEVPVDWQESKYLEAEPGDFITVVRKDKNSENWFLGAITDENNRDTEIKLDFLSPNKKYQAIVYQDGKDADWQNNPKSYAIKTIQVTLKSKIKLHLAKGGGAAISFKPIN